MMAEVEAEEKAAEEQVLSWVYEYAVKFNYSEVITRIENISEVQGISSLPTSARFAYYLRRLKQISNFSEVRNLNQMLQLTDELLRLNQYQGNVEVYNQIILLNVASKLLLLNNQVVSNAALHKQLALFNWQELKQEYNLTNDDYKKRFKTCLDWARECIDNFVFNKEKIIHLSEFALLECQDRIESAQQTLAKLLFEVFPDTALERISCSEEICERLAEQQIKAYANLMKLVEKGFTEASLSNFLDTLFKHNESGNLSCGETARILENFRFNSDKSVLVEEEKSSEFPMALTLDSEDIVLINNKLRKVKSKQWHPVHFPRPTNADVFESTVQDKGESHFSETIKPDSMDTVLVNGKLVKIKSKPWLPVTCSRPTHNDSTPESPKAALQLGGPKNHQEIGEYSHKPLLCAGETFVCINNKMRKVKSKQWHPVFFSPPSYSSDSQISNDTMQEQVPSEILEELKSCSLSSVLINGKMVEVKNKPWHPISLCRSLGDESYPSSSEKSHLIPYPSKMKMQERSPAAERSVIAESARNEKESSQGSQKQRQHHQSTPRPAGSSSSKIAEAVNRVCSESSKERDLERLITELEPLLKMLKLKLANIKKQEKSSMDDSTLCHYDTSNPNIGKKSEERRKPERDGGTPGLEATPLYSNIDSVAVTIPGKPTFPKSNGSVAVTIPGKQTFPKSNGSVAVTIPGKPAFPKSNGSVAVTIPGKPTFPKANGKRNSKSVRKTIVECETKSSLCKQNVEKTGSENTVMNISSDSDKTFYSALDSTETKTQKERKNTGRRICSENEEGNASGTRRRIDTDSREENCTSVSSHADETYHTAFDYCNESSYAVVKPCFVPLKRICLERRESSGKKNSRIKGEEYKKGT